MRKTLAKSVHERYKSAFKDLYASVEIGVLGVLPGFSGSAEGRRVQSPGHSQTLVGLAARRERGTQHLNDVGPERGNAKVAGIAE
jgi:hypothetical protein